MFHFVCASNEDSSVPYVIHLGWSEYASSTLSYWLAFYIIRYFLCLSYIVYDSFVYMALDD